MTRLLPTGQEPASTYTAEAAAAPVDRQLRPAATVRVLDGVVTEIVRELTSVAPERGGALMGLRDPHLVSLLVFDAHGEYSAASWAISAELGVAVGELERDGSGLLLGTVHSHPASVPDPSGQDQRATARLLQANPHMEQAAVLIVTQGPARTWDLSVPGADGRPWRISAHLMRRAATQHRPGELDGQFSWERAAIEVVPLAADLAPAGVTFGCGASTEQPAVSPDLERRGDRRSGPGRGLGRASRPGSGSPDRSAARPVLHPYRSSLRLAIPVTGLIEPGADRGRKKGGAVTVGVLLVHGAYPEVGPVAVSLDDLLGGDPTPVRRPQAARERGGLNVDEAQPRLSRCGLWDPEAPAGRQLQRLVRRLRGSRIDGAADRAWPLVGDLSTRTVLVVGAGSVGSSVAEQLVRSGVGAVRILDEDVVTAPNLARSSYRSQHLDQPKVHALSALLTEVDPAVRVTAVPATIGALTPSQLDALIDGVDLTILATDDMYEQASLAHRLYAAGVAHVSCALYAKAAAGEVTVVIPDLDGPCWHCHVGGARSGGSRGVTNYGVSSRLVGEAGLSPSITLVSSYAALTALAVLAGPGSPAWAGLEQRVVAHRTLGVVSTVPGWEWFTTLLEGTAVAGGAPQSVWLQVQRDPACSVCGTDRTAPADDAAVDDIDAVFAELERNANVPLPESLADAPGISPSPTPGQATHTHAPDDERRSAMVKENKAASLLRRKQINAAGDKRNSKKVTSRKVHDTGGKDLHGRQR